MGEAKLSAHEERRVAVEAGVDPRTVRAFLLGRKQSSTTAGRVRETLLKLGHGRLLVPAPGDVTVSQPMAADCGPESDGFGQRMRPVPEAGAR